jgi:hypothetical protein
MQMKLSYTTTQNITEADVLDLLSRAPQPHRPKGHGKSTLTKAIEIPTSVNQIIKRKIRG